MLGRLGHLRDWRLPAPERRAARAERRAEAAIRTERDSQHHAERRAAALEAEARRHSSHFPHMGSGGWPGGTP